MKKILLTAAIFIILLWPDGALAELTFLQANQDGASATEYTFSGESLGAAAADRYIIIGVNSRGLNATRTLDAVTVGGESATVVTQTPNTTSHTTLSGIAIVLVASGTTGDVVVTFDAGMLRCGIGLWRADSLDSATPNDTGGSTAADPTYDIDINAGGFAVGTVHAVGDVGQATAVWTGIAEDYDQQLEGVSSHTGASDTFVAQQTNLTLTATLSNTQATLCTGAFASWDMTEAPEPTPTPVGKPRRDIIKIKSENLIVLK